MPGGAAEDVPRSHERSHGKQARTRRWRRNRFKNSSVLQPCWSGAHGAWPPENPGLTMRPFERKRRF